MSEFDNEVQELWGTTAEYQQSKERTSKYSHADFALAKVVLRLLCGYAKESGGDVYRGCPLQKVLRRQSARAGAIRPRRHHGSVELESGFYSETKERTLLRHLWNISILAFITFYKISTRKF